ncbi:abortive infection system toxin AbiGii family protein [Bacillus sp. B3-WWTP-C-10-D-3]|uniref:abortive infection system toxin AbiGii family protein n=1 Tax=Bacillus sp. B3-WWTP-C-10-D-3 TaxID=2653217 RepID=UPI001D02C946|nr:abortive infection system toxin AbiGii family protein [Bacillus sp. B3-WWTP-C-10-D-3]
MFTNFKKAFEKDESKVHKIPQAILDALSDNLPKGLKYEQFEANLCRLVPEENKEFKLGFPNLNIDIPEGIEIHSVDKLNDFLYRTQQEVKVTDEIIYINGEERPVTDLLKSPFNKSGQSEFVFVPAPFPAPIPVVISHEREQIQKVFNMQRQPFANMSKSLFKSTESGPLEISFILDETDMSLTFNIKISISKAQTVLEIVESAKLYMGFLEGDIKFSESLIPPISNEAEQTAVTKALEYWEKVLAISNKLNVVFNPKEKIDDEELSWISKLYRTLIEKKPYKIRVREGEFFTEFSNPIDSREFPSDEPMVFQYTQKEIIKIYGVKIEVHSVEAYINCKFVDFRLLEGEKYKYAFKVEAASNQGLYQSAMHFISNEELEQNTGSPEDVIKMLSTAEEL